ncbi:MAG: hypothetical protein A2V79_10720 [Betaproteobacteria bacterium RBG_16_56_24]|nr:MAG: hypothetical protein A2V79_10720 [Betaproteobacteria bacterium RBG_16_56_24]
MKRTIHCLAVVSSLTLIASLAHAEPGSHGDHKHGAMHDRMGEMHFMEMDADGDKMISRAEFDAAHNKHFQQMDADSNGKITHEEMEAARGKWGNKHDMGMCPERDKK